MDGILLVDKPSGWTSFDVVAKIRGILRQDGITRPKVGHTGTLDPLATGLLVIVLGNYCKRAQEFTKLDKTYEVTMKLGMTSLTGDEEGNKTKISDAQPSNQEILDVMTKFEGKIRQVPPAYSAIKINGQRAYKLARAGKEVELESREVEIYSIQTIVYSYPEVKFTTEVSSGTYIRTLVEDIGEKLGTGAYTSALRRTKINGFDINNALPVQELIPGSVESRLIT